MDKNDVVILELDRPRELKLTHKVLKRFMARKKVSMENFDSAVQSYEGMTDLICEMLRREDPALTEEQCDDLLDAVTIKEILEKGAQAIAAGFGSRDEEGTEEGNPTK